MTPADCLVVGGMRREVARARRERRLREDAQTARCAMRQRTSWKSCSGLFDLSRFPVWSTFLGLCRGSPSTMSVWAAPQQLLQLGQYGAGDLHGPHSGVPRARHAR